MAAAMAYRRDAIFCVFTGHIVETQNSAFLFWGRRKILRLYRAAKYCVFILGETQNIASLRAAFEPFI